MKTNLKKVLATILKLFLLIIAIIIIFLFYSFITHQIKIKNEMKYLENYNTGKIIKINNKKVNYKIFNEDNNLNTILLMSASGATDLSLSFEPLAKNINAKIILINRPGYGYTEDSNKDANIEYIVYFYRNVLKELDIKDNIYLMPQSISGMYAMYWTEFFPNEIKGIIGLDIGSPYMYLDNLTNNFSNFISYLGSKLGIHRFIYKKDNSNTVIRNYDIYSNDVFQAIWNMNMINPYSKFNLSEENLIKENANKVIKNMNDNYYNMKKLYIIATSISGNFYEKYEKENLINYYKNENKVKEHIESLKKYQEKEIKSLSLDENTSFVTVEGPHLLYYYPTDLLVNSINEFLK